MAQQELVAEALAAFRKMAGPIGLKLGTFSATLLSARSDPPRVVLRLTDGERALVLTWLEPKAEAMSMIRGAEAQAAAQAAMPEGAFVVPRVLAADRAARAVLTEQAQGIGLEKRLIDGEPPEALLHRAGGWLSAFHLATAGETRPYNPGFMLAHIAKLADDASRRPASLPEEQAFQRCCAALPAMAGSSDGVMVPNAQSHADLGARQMFLSGTEVAVIGFRTQAMAPVIFDVARLLTDVIQVTLPPTDATGEFALPPAVTDGFFGAYRLLRPDDPVLQFQLRVRLLAEWRAIPGNPALRSWRQGRRWQSIRNMADRMFPN